MDQIKIGKFIAELRKERGLTQRELADLLAISDKTVSKWERGSGLPEVSLMMPLCGELGITVNELLTGKRLLASEYQKIAEANIMKLIAEKELGKRLLIVQIVTVVLTILAACALIMVSGVVEMPTGWRIALIAIGVVTMVGGIGVAVALDLTYGSFECAKCGERFVPTAGAYLWGVHTATRRHLKCPKCGKWSMAIRRLTGEEEKEDK